MTEHCYAFCRCMGCISSSNIRGKDACIFCFKGLGYIKTLITQFLCNNCSVVKLSSGLLNFKNIRVTSLRPTRLRHFSASCIAGPAWVCALSANIDIQDKPMQDNLHPIFESKPLDSRPNYSSGTESIMYIRAPLPLKSVGGEELTVSIPIP